MTYSEPHFALHLAECLHAVVLAGQHASHRAVLSKERVGTRAVMLPLDTSRWLALLKVRVILDGWNAGTKVFFLRAHRCLEYI